MAESPSLLGSLSTERHDGKARGQGDPPGRENRNAVETRTALPPCGFVACWSGRTREGMPDPGLLVPMTQGRDAMTHTRTNKQTHTHTHSSRRYDELRRTQERPCSRCRELTDPECPSGRGLERQLALDDQP